MTTFDVPTTPGSSTVRADSASDPASDPLRASSVDVVRAYCAAWASGDPFAVLAYYHDDLSLTWRGGHRLAGTYVGLQASVEALIELGSLTDREPVEVLDVLEGTDGVIAVVRERWTRGDESIEVLRALSFTLLDGKLRTCRVFEFDQAAIDDWLA